MRALKSSMLMCPAAPGAGAAASAFLSVVVMLDLSAWDASPSAGAAEPPSSRLLKNSVAATLPSWSASSWSKTYSACSSVSIGLNARCAPVTNSFRVEMLSPLVSTATNASTRSVGYAAFARSLNSASVIGGPAFGLAWPTGLSWSAMNSSGDTFLSLLVSKAVKAYSASFRPSGGLNVFVASRNSSRLRTLSWSLSSLINEASELPSSDREPPCACGVTTNCVTSGILPVLVAARPFAHAPRKATTQHGSATASTAIERPTPARTFLLTRHALCTRLRPCARRRSSAESPRSMRHCDSATPAAAMERR
mmetsp:Transcript_76818/g.197830  ORF Transcript_76818/g.197830 Transcript_76818/m.197830 type:complete len:309 (+) Transcript_76818:256-1182(+)